MKTGGRILTALFLALAVLGFSGGDAPLAQTAKTIKVEFSEDGKPTGRVFVNDKQVQALKPPYAVTITATNSAGVAFLQTEASSPAWCYVIVGGIQYKIC
jgi:hypothetical protein